MLLSVCWPNACSICRRRPQGPLMWEPNSSCSYLRVWRLCWATLWLAVIKELDAVVAVYKLVKLK